MPRNFVILASDVGDFELDEGKLTLASLDTLLGVSTLSATPGVSDPVDLKDVMFPWSELLPGSPVISPSRFHSDERDDFDRFSSDIQKAILPDHQLVAIIDQVDLAELNPLRSHGWSSLVAMLILAFPDVRWVFLRARYSKLREAAPSSAAISSPDKKRELRRVGEAKKQSDLLESRSAALRSDHSIDKIFAPRGNPLFDDRGVRDWVIRLSYTQDLIDNRSGSQHLADHLRNVCAIVLDEERDFREFHSLMLYGMGLRVESVESWSQAIQLLGKEARDNRVSSTSSTAAPITPAPTSPPTIPLQSNTTQESCNWLVSLEDLYLNYADQAVRQMSDLEERDRTLVELKKITHRRFVTIGHRHRNPKERENYLRQQKWLWKQRLEYRGAKRLKHSEQVTLKPGAGIYHLWFVLGLDRQPELTRKRGDVDHPELLVASDEDGHSSPGRLLQIAEFLIGRAKRLRSNTESVHDAVLGAQLSIQAHELLGGKTPVLWLEAYMLQHEFEVAAECQFAGVQHHLEIRRRTKSIRERIKKRLEGYLGGRQSQRDQSLLNSELAILERIVDVLRKYDQFDEEQMVMCRIRDIQRKLMFSKRTPALRIVQPIVWYIHKLVGSMPLFVCSIMGWILILSILNYQVANGLRQPNRTEIEGKTTVAAIPTSDLKENEDFSGVDGFATAFISFFGLGQADGGVIWKPEEKDGGLGALLVSLSVFLGFIHLGVFVALINSAIQRK